MGGPIRPGIPIFGTGQVDNAGLRPGQMYIKHKAMAEPGCTDTRVYFVLMVEYETREKRKLHMFYEYHLKLQVVPVHHHPMMHLMGAPLVPPW